MKKSISKNISLKNYLLASIISIFLFTACEEMPHSCDTDPDPLIRIDAKSNIAYNSSKTIRSVFIDDKTPILDFAFVTDVEAIKNPNNMYPTRELRAYQIHLKN